MRISVFFLVLLLLGCESSKEENLTPALEAMTSPAGENASLPYLVVGQDENLYFSWVQMKDSGRVTFNYSSLIDDKWSEPEMISQGNNWFVNWADYPMLAVNSAGGMMAHYLAKSDTGTYSYDVNLIIKPVGETKWSDPMVPHSDNTLTEHGFVTILPGSNNNFHIAWLDGRNTGGSDHNHHGGAGAMTLRTAMINLDGEILSKKELDNRVCDCCQTTGVMINENPLFIYRDRSAMEIRDLSIVRKVDSTWTIPTNLHEDGWNIEGCPVNGPRADALENNLVVAWYTAANNQPKIKVAFSKDGGNTFNDPIVVDNISPLGRVDVIMTSSDSALITWMSNAGSESKILGRTVEASRKLSDSFTISPTNESRGSGFPQVAMHKEYVYFAWTTLENGKSGISLKRMKLF